MLMEFAQFILQHDGEDPAQLALARSRFAGEVADFDLALTTLEVRRKLRDKVPEWYAVPSLRFPLRVSGEQCSSSATARYKASVASPYTESASLVHGRRIADLTGGLGVDSWAFAQVFDEVLYNEMRPELADAAAHNFRELGVSNITVRNFALVPHPAHVPHSALVPHSGLDSHSGLDPESPAAGSVMAGSDRPSSVTEVLDGFRHGGRPTGARSSGWKTASPMCCNCCRNCWMPVRSSS